VILIIIAYFMPKGLAGLVFTIKARYIDRITAKKTRKEAVDVTGN
jgi:hypothetical protein